MQSPDGRQAHPDRGALQRFHGGQAECDRGGGVISHLLTDCAVCREITGPLTPFGRATDVVAAVSSSEESTAAEHTASARLLKHSKDANRRWRSNRNSDSPRRVGVTGSRSSTPVGAQHRRFSTWGVTEQLIDESYRHRFHDTKGSLEYAELEPKLRIGWTSRLTAWVGSTNRLVPGR